jgi:preprotein translocase subunit SecD
VSGNLGWRTAIVIGAVLIAFICLTPSITRDLPSWWSWGNILPKDRIQLGLDLQGGIHMRLEVKAEKAVENTLERAVEALKRDLRSKRLRYRQLARQGTEGIGVTLMREDDVGVFEELAKANYPDYEWDAGTIVDKGVVFDLILSPGARESIMRTAVDQAVEKIRTRIEDKWKGLKKPEIRRKGDREIVVQLPGVDERDYGSVRKLIEQQALLEFKLVDDVHSVDDALKGNKPPGTQILYHRESKRPLLLKKRTLLTGDTITDARVHFGQFSEPEVSLSFSKRGARVFSEITGENVGKRLAIILDNMVFSAPRINEQIREGRAQITGRFTDDEARDLSIALRSGSLKAPVVIEYESVVGPSLGKDSIEKGFKSMLIGGGVVIIFIMIYYGLSGFIADLAVLLNILFIMAGLALFGAELSLPGIAGIILTIGMSVDANVLIFERIREELRLGKTPRAAIEGGYGKALVTILDAQVTTLIAALVLFQVGTGPVKGFAVTLSIGIVASLFTAIFVTRVIFDYLYVQRRMRKISI